MPLNRWLQNVMGKTGKGCTSATNCVVLSLMGAFMPSMIFRNGYEALYLLLDVNVFIFANPHESLF